MNTKTICLCAAFLLYFNAEAQIEKGRILAGGSLGFSSSNYREVIDGNTEAESTTTYLWLIPRVGYFFTDAIAAGAGISLSTQTTKYEDDDTFNSSSISFSPFARYYLPQGLFGQVEFGIGTESEKWKLPNGEEDTEKFKLFSWSIGAGYAIFLNDNVAVEPMITYNATTYTDSNESDFKDKYGDLTFQIGFNIYLNAP